MSKTRETTMKVTGLHAVRRGVDRPEHVVVAGDGRVFASDRPLLSQNSSTRTPFGA
jgi:hypothetical protein